MSLSDMISSLSLAVAVGAFIHSVTSKKAMKEWLEQRKRERMAEVASDALVAVFIMTRFLTNRALDTRPDRPNALALQAVDKHWASAGDVFEKLWLARVSVEVHIPGAVSPMEDLLKFAEKFSQRQSAFAACHLGREPYDDPETHNAFGEIPEQQIKDLHAKARAALLLPAQLRA